MSPECSCGSDYRHAGSRAAWLLFPNGVQAYAYNMDCVEHGLGSSSYRQMRPVTKRAYLNVEQAWAASRMDGAKLIEKHSSGRMALIEWIEWEFYDTHSDEELTKDEVSADV